MAVSRGRIMPAILAVIIILASLAACGGSREVTGDEPGKKVELKYSTLLKIHEAPGYTLVKILNPWDTLKTLHRYVLVPADSVLPQDLPAGTVIRTPINRALLYSSVHCGLLKELGAGEAISGICGREYMKDSLIIAGLASGRIADCGDNMNPDTEKIIRLHPEAILASPYQNGDSYGKASQLGIPVIECADYMESSDLGRAEWMRFFGLLFGKREQADRVFSAVEKEYLHLSELAAGAKEHPKVLIDQRYGQAWDVPGANSTTGRRIADAGGINPFSSITVNGSRPLAPEKVLAEAGDADVWLLRYYQDNEKSMAELAADSPVNSRFKAFKEGNVYGCNTKKKDLYEETPFHPERLMRDMVIILHPSLLPGESPKYFEKMR